MDWRDLPSLNALKAFSALAQTGSYAGAGARLNVTHAAVMQQVRALEEHVSVKLVERAGRGVVLTDAGRKLALSLDAGFQHVFDGVRALTATEAERPVQVTMSPAFAVKWLMPRLAGFQEEHPEITLLLLPSGRNIDLTPGGMDVAIRYCRREVLPKGSDVLLELDLAVVGTPTLWASRVADTPADLQDFPWLQELGTREVPDWFSRYDILPGHPLAISHMPGNLILDSTLRGDGLTYTGRQWVNEALKAGELIARYPEDRAGVFCIHTVSGQMRPAVKAFVNWLKAQSAGPL